MKQRFWEVDTLRGIAIIKMIISNFMLNLIILDIYDFNAGHNLLWFFSRIGIAATIFIFLVGVCLTISFSRVRHMSRKDIYKKYFRRGTWILFLGMLITLVTMVLFSRNTIYFGVLHFIGLSVILAVPFLRYRLANLFMGIIIILTGIYLGGFSFDFPWLLWLGFVPQHFQTFDYFPLLPWFGVILLGIFAGNLLYPDGKRVFRIPDLSRFRVIGFFSFLGRKSLYIYLLHQPIIFAVLYLFVV